MGSGASGVVNPAGPPGTARGAGSPATSSPAGRSRVSPLATDVVLLVLAVIVPAMVLALHRGFVADDPTPDAGGSVLALALAVPLVLLRRRWPVPVLAIAVFLAVVVITITDQRSPLLIAVVILLFTVASESSRRTALVAGAVTGVALYLTAATQLDGAAIGADSLASVAWTGLAVAAGDAVRTRRAYVEAVEERARRAEETREEEARRRVVEERLRIARELHDVVAHRMAVITVQAAAASQLLGTDPDRAAESMEHVRSSASTVLQELGALLHVLRVSDDEPAGGSAPSQPAPTLADVDELVASFAAVGLQVTRRAVTPCDDEPEVPEAVALTVYRLVQEALTNAHRHGAGDAELTIDRGAEQVRLTVSNHLRADPAPRGSGLGIAGMTERITAVGGTLTTGLVPDPGGDRFVVDARIPLTPAAVPLDPRDHPDPREPRDPLDPRDHPDPRDPRDPLDPRDHPEHPDTGRP
jgi:signal transduction histidine kinase